jgi:hypothetical protein
MPEYPQFVHNSIHPPPLYQYFCALKKTNTLNKMKKITWTVRFVLLLSLVQLVSCTKSLDTQNTDSISLQTSSDATAADVTSCRIVSMKQDYGGGQSTANFYYNALGNPSSIKYTPNATGTPNYYFYYDAQNRLKEMRKTFNNGATIYERHKYIYNNNNVCIRDTMIQREGGVYVWVSSFEYDAQGRIVKETIKHILSPNGILQKTKYKTFTYDNRGNLGVLNWPSSKYDYKTSPLRTNPIFMFLLRNYSKNNPAPQPKYNAKGLPLSLNPSNYMLFNDNVTYEIVYQCK